MKIHNNTHHNNNPIETEEQDSSLNKLYAEINLLKHHSSGQLKQDLGNLESCLSTASNAVAQDPDSDPFSFQDHISISENNAIFALAEAINNLLGDQPDIIGAQMAIQNGLLSPMVDAASRYWVGEIEQDSINIANFVKNGDPKDPGYQGQLDSLQAVLSKDNAASSASSTGLNGVMSMASQEVSSKTTTYQNLVQEAQSIVTALLNAMSTNWVL